MAWYFGHTLVEISVDDRGDGLCGFENPLANVIGDPGPDEIDNQTLDPVRCHEAILISLAGTEACRVAGDADCDEGDDEDELKAWDVCERISRTMDEAIALRDWLRLRAGAILRQPPNWRAVRAVAGRLDRERKLAGDVAEAEIRAAIANDL